MNRIIANLLSELLKWIDFIDNKILHPIVS